MKTKLNFPLIGNWNCVETNSSFSGVLYKDKTKFLLKCTSDKPFFFEKINADGNVRWYLKLPNNKYCEVLARQKATKSVGDHHEFMFVVDVILMTTKEPSLFNFTEFKLQTTNVLILDKKIITNKYQNNSEEYKLLMSSSRIDNFFAFSIKYKNSLNFTEFLSQLDHIQSLYFFHYEFSINFKVCLGKNERNESIVIHNVYATKPHSKHKQPIDLDDLYQFTLNYFDFWHTLSKNEVFVDVIYNLKTAILDIEERGFYNKFMMLPIQQSYEGLASSLNLDLKINQELSKDQLKIIKQEVVKKANEMKLSQFVTDRLSQSLDFVRSGSAKDKILAIINFIPEDSVIKILETDKVNFENTKDNFVKNFNKQRNYLNHFSKENFSVDNIVSYFPLISMLFKFINTYLDANITQNDKNIPAIAKEL